MRLETGSAGKRRLAVAVLFAVALVFACASAGWGAVSLQRGKAGCFAAKRFDTCWRDGTLKGAEIPLVSADGRNLYVAGYQGDALHVFDRDPITGRLTKPRGKASCFSESLEVCTHVRGFDEPLEFALSRDGADLDALAGDSDSLAIFDRDPNTGALHQKDGTAGCISATGAGGCQADPLIDEPSVITISPDGKSVYVVNARTEALLVFSRDPATGDLTQVPGVAGCLSTVQGGITAACGHAPLGRTLERLQVTPDGTYVYLDENLTALGGKPAGVVLRLKRDPASGQLTFERARGDASAALRWPRAAACTKPSKPLLAWL